MSLELTIQENTATLKRLIAVLTETLPQPVHVHLGEAPPAENSAPIAATPAEIEQPDPPKKMRAKKEAAPATVGEPAPEQPVPSPDAGASAAPATEAAATATKPPTYADAAAAVTQVLKKHGKAKAVGILQACGADHLTKVKPEDYAAVICACELALA